MSRAAFVVPAPQATALRALNYIPEVERMRTMTGSDVSRPLRTLLRGMGRSYGTVFTRLDCLPPHGIELLSQSDMFAVEPEGRRIRLDSLPFPQRHEIRRGQVLLAGAGTLGPTELYGRAVYADARLAGKYVGPDAMVLDFEEPDSDDALFAYAFLCTPLGISAIRSTSYGTKLLRFRSDLIGSLPIPQVDSVVQSRVAERIRAAVRSWEWASELLSSIRGVIAALPVIRAAGNIKMKGPSAVMWDDALPTISAWTYASTGGALRLLRSEWHKRLRDAVAPGGIYYGERFARIECAVPHGMELLSQRDVFMVRQIPRRVSVFGVDLDRLRAAPSTLLVGGHGQLSEGSLFGRVELAGAGLDRYAVSEDILRIVPRAPDAAMAFAFLSTGLGLRLLRATAYGTSIPKMRADLLENLPFPEADSTTFDQVNYLTEELMRARREAREAEAESITIVEKEVIPAWLS